MAPKLTPSLENYLRVIFEIVEEQGAVRAKDISGRLDVSNASVTGALRELEKRRYVNYTPYGVITLTREGRRLGRELQRARAIISAFLVNVLAVDAHQADKAACEMEHAVSREIMDRFVAFFEFVKACPHTNFVWDEMRGFHCDARSACCTTKEGNVQGTKSSKGRRRVATRADQ